ncbi:MAG: ABC transporter ATP-binding protein [Sphingomonadales bacterium]|nr:ABC transporter ATP-binding protein [Sphingomonadales bacterium]
MLNVSSLYKRYGTLEILRGLSLQVPKAQVAAIVGPSGCGKSTLLHLIGTLDRPDNGKVEINGTDVFRLSSQKLAAFRNKHIGFVFQFHHLLPEFSALENVSIPGWIAGHSKGEVKEEATRLLDTLGLSHRLDHKPAALSGGEQQRVAVARALINRPDIILADEPSGNLDSIQARELHQLFFSLRDKTGQTFLVVTHNQELAGQCDKVWTMKDGMLLEN